MNTYPGISVQLQLSCSVDRLLEELLDVAIRVGYVQVSWLTDWP